MAGKFRDVLVELLEALVRFGRVARSSFLVKLTLLSSAKFAYFLKRSEEVTFVHREAKSQQQQKQNVLLEPCFGAKVCR